MYIVSLPDSKAGDCILTPSLFIIQITEFKGKRMEFSLSFVVFFIIKVTDDKQILIGPIIFKSRYKEIKIQTQKETFIRNYKYFF